MKIFGFIVVAFLLSFVVIDLHLEKKQLQEVQTFLKHDDARVVWTEPTADGGSKSFTYWNGDKCQAVVLVKGSIASFSTPPYCLDIKLTMD